MKVLGKFMGGYNSRNCAVGGYIVFYAEEINVETYSGVSVYEDKRCFLKLATSYFLTAIKKTDGNYIDPELANTLVRDIATKEMVDLDKYDMGFFDIADIRPDSICITNEVDEDYNTIPLVVTSE